jgi:pyruvate dehydrogenase E2 component (dihydrolipoamide acetyltransferase)
MATEVRLPPIAADTHEGTLVRWTTEVGATVVRGDTIAEFETAKTVVELEAPVTGTLLATVAPEGSEIAVGELVAWIGKPGETPPEAGSGDVSRIQSPVTPEIPVPEAPVRPRIRATPVVMRLAIKRGVDITTITGTGPNRRVTKDDVEQAAAERNGQR